MSKPEPTYRKLPGGGISWAGFARVWLASDHVLEVNALIFHERYRRFFLPDIEACVLQRTKVRFYWNLAAGIALAITGSISAAFIYFATRSDAGSDGPPLMFFGVVFGFIAFVALILLLVNTLLGPTCRVHLKTSAGWHPLAAPRRSRKGRRFLVRMAPLIEEAQRTKTPVSPAAEAFS